MRWLLGFSLVFLAVSIASAASRELEINFDFTPPAEMTVAAYKLSEDGIVVCNSPIANITAAEVGSVMTCEFDTTNGGHQYTLVAIFSDGSESPPSPEYQYTIKRSWGGMGASGHFKVRARIYLPDPE